MRGRKVLSPRPGKSSPIFWQCFFSESSSRALRARRRIRSRDLIRPLVDERAVFQRDPEYAHAARVGQVVAANIGGDEIAGQMRSCFANETPRNVATNERRRRELSVGRHDADALRLDEF